MTKIENKVYLPGSLVKVRERDWVVLPSNDENLLLLKPLDGSEDEVTGIYMPLAFEEDRVESAQYPPPSVSDLGAFSSARLLYNAARLSVRNVSGPFRSIGKLSFRPRAYQMVPLIMALRQDQPVRLLIADDVGVGKTIEALIILKELLERKEIERFAVIAPPHLCGQWQAELREKFGIEAVVIRSNTQARLDRQIYGDTGVFKFYPYQVISVDYIKSETRRQMFIQDCPELVIVDEAHTCTERTGRSDSGQQQRYRLLNELSRDKSRHMLLLTATPHSGKAEQFNSLLGLLQPEFRTLDVPEADRRQRRRLARYYVQRRRKDVERWSRQDTVFPERESGEYIYHLSPKYKAFYDKVSRFALGLTAEGGGKLRYWAALALLRGVMSSPAAGLEMLKNRAGKKHDNLKSEKSECKSFDFGADGQESENKIEPGDIPANHFHANPLMDDESTARDHSPSGVLDQVPWKDSETARLSKFASELKGLHGTEHDRKAAEALSVVADWLRNGFNTVVFCRFIRTANYIGEIIKAQLAESDPAVLVETVTSEDPDDVRRERIDRMADVQRKVLVATDCLSEGINLQEQFTAVLHYDLPWNPNRLEQREGRVDRFGQRADSVKAYVLYSKENPIDHIVFKVLLEKVRMIRKATGISIPLPEDNQSFLDAVLQEVMAGKNRLLPEDGTQRSFAFDVPDTMEDKVLTATREIEAAAEREKRSRSIFAQNAVKPDEIEADLMQADRSAGAPEDVEAFVTEALKIIYGVQLKELKSKNAYILYTVNLPEPLKSHLSDSKEARISFYSPTPEGYEYIGRNHPFVEQLCRMLLARALSPEPGSEPRRASVIRCREVREKTVLLLSRARNVIEERHRKTLLVAEELIVWGYVRRGDTYEPLPEERVHELLRRVSASSELTPEAREHFLEAELYDIDGRSNSLDEVARQRAQLLVEAHERFRRAVGGSRFEVVEPVLPMDFIGVYILLPEVGQ